MDTHDSRSRFRRPSLSQLLITLSAALVLIFGFAAGTSSSAMDGAAAGNIQLPQGAPAQTGEDIEKEFDDDDLKVKAEKPRGKWSFATLLDRSQFEDPSIPVAVRGIQSLSGAGRHFGVTKIKRVELTNRSSRIVSAVQFRWTVASLEDPTKVLSEGTTQLVSARVEANETSVIEIPTMHPALLLKPLAKEGSLFGRFQITFGVQEARFADGPFWRRQEFAAGPMSPGPEQSPAKE